MIPKHVLSTLKQLNRFSYPQICRHYAGLILLDTLQAEFPELNQDPDFLSLVDALSKNSDGDEDLSKIVDSALDAPLPIA